MMPGTKGVPDKSLWLNARSGGPEAKTTAGAHPAHVPISRQGWSSSGGGCWGGGTIPIEEGTLAIERTSDDKIHNAFKG